MPTTCGPNVTASRIRRICGDCCLRRYRVDPTWGIPIGTPPLCMDAITGLVRPASSYVTAAAANGAFIGFANEWFPPGEDHTVWVATCGWVEMELLTAAAVAVGDGFILTADHSLVRDQYVMPAGQADPIFWAVEACWCENAWVKRDVCLATAGAPDDTSSTPVPTDQMTQRTVILQWGDCCKSSVYVLPE